MESDLDLTTDHVEENRLWYLHTIKGYPKLECVKALKQANGHIDQAVQLLSKMQKSKSVDKF